MAKRMLVMLTLTLLIVGGLGFVKFRQVQAAIAEGAAYQAPPEAVTTVVATRAEWASTHHAIGTVDAVRGVTVSADLAGIVDQVRRTGVSTVQICDRPQPGPAAALRPSAGCRQPVGGPFGPGNRCPTAAARAEDGS